MTRAIDCKAIPLDEILAEFTPEQRAEIERRAADIVRKSDAFRVAREAVVQVQSQIAAKLGIDQEAMARMERRTDRYVATLRKLIKKLGGTLDIVVHLPDKDAIRIVQFRDTDAWPARKRRRVPGKAGEAAENSPLEPTAKPPE